MGHSPKYSEKTSALIVAEETMTLNSGLDSRTRFRSPRMKSMLRLRSWASSTMMIAVAREGRIELHLLEEYAVGHYLDRRSHRSVLSSKRIL